MKRDEMRARKSPHLMFMLSLAAPVLIILITACNSTSNEPTVITLSVSNLVATLEDEVQELPQGRIAWSTYWKLCWDQFPKAKAYELQVMTGEGISSTLRRQTERCFRIEVAAGKNEKSQGLYRRDVQLALQSGQLAYRVRAVLDGNKVSEWSPAKAAGAVFR